ncbi:hypothetical protein HG264_15490 [Pseudomonas sp. gcc21]|uniref:DUF6776 family protein n=1 Tax=Pseudomonas sp. gcc21 TaxID=2726989 RepID=UPI0014511572|nr:DUF6776 family protein [Pseudomonas sp. gcc21]QJD60188.1 hypothetical protein HG264_15490 [Pseudomonas sp. gcc21]
MTDQLLRRVPLRRGHRLAVIPVESRFARLVRRVLAVFVLLAFPAAAWLGWDAALRSKLVENHSQLRDSHQTLQAELEQTQQRYQQLEVDLLVAREAVRDGRKIITDLEQQLFKLQQDLAIYQGALAPNAMVPGLRFQAFELQPTERPDVFRYKVMVSRVGSESETTQATLFIEVHGSRDGEEVVIPLSSMTTVGDDEGLALDFRYFQVLPANGREAELSLPEGFQPKRVHLRAEHDGKTLVEQMFDWTVTGAKS